MMKEDEGRRFAAKKRPSRAVSGVGVTMSCRFVTRRSFSGRFQPCGVERVSGLEGEYSKTVARWCWPVRDFLHTIHLEG
jgi:hypothetical protein